MHLWHTLKIEELCTELKTSDKGLSDVEANDRLKQYGFNEIEAKKTPLWKKIIEPFRSIFILILLFAAIVSFVTHEALDGSVIAVIIAINAIIYYTQAHTTGRVLKGLNKQSQQFISALRDGQKVQLPARLLVPGDVILLNEGQRVPADARVLSEENLFMSEAALTGESLPIKKQVSVLAKEKPVFEQDNMVFSGTYVASGSGRVLIVATGPHTQFGTIAKMAVGLETKSPMQQKIDSIVTRLIKVLAVVAVVVFGLSMLRGIETGEALRFIMAMSVSAIPEDLPIALTVVAVLGMRRMAKKNALVRSMRTIEDLGLTTVIATDKTGTLTQNKLKVIEAWSPTAETDMKSVGQKALGNVEDSTEPFDHALKSFAGASTDSNKLLKNYPFNQAQRMSGALWDEAGKKLLYIKGAPEHLLNLCKLDPSAHKKSESELHSLVAKGFRVIAFAKCAVDSTPKDLNEVVNLKPQFLGLIAFADELRPESAAAIAAAQKAGIAVKMITGDHFETAFHIGQTLGISTHRDQVIMGGDLPQTEEELVPLLKTKTVFARILPEKKFHLLKALKRSEITAMTGDGVNDVPALTNAHVGIAMGSGNDIAKDAGDIVLLDDSFSSIVNAVSEGRVIYDNIRRMLFHLLSTSLGEILTMIGALIVGLPLPATAIMILWVNLVTDTCLAIPLGLEPPEMDHMQRPPRHPKAPILDRLVLSRIVIVGLAMAVPILLIFNSLIKSGYSLEYAQTIAFMMLVSSQWVNALNARSERSSVISRLKVVNYKLLIGLMIAIILQILVMFGPLKRVFNIVPVSGGHLAMTTLITLATVLITVELHKLYYRLLRKSY